MPSWPYNVQVMAGIIFEILVWKKWGNEWKILTLLALGIDLGTSHMTGKSLCYFVQGGVPNPKN